MSAPDDIRESVRKRYAEAATQPAVGGQGQACAPETSCCGPTPVSINDAQGRVVFGAELYGPDAAGAPGAALAASLGCGVPTAVADLSPGEVVWIWAPAPAPTSSSPPAGSPRVGVRSGWT